MATYPPASALPAPSNEKKVKMTCYLEPALLKALQHESVERKMSLGALVEEAVRSRTSTTWK